MYDIGKIYLLKVKNPDYNNHSIYICKITDKYKNKIEVYTIKNEKLILEIDTIKFSKEETEEKFNRLKVVL